MPGDIGSPPRAKAASWEDYGKMRAQRPIAPTLPAASRAGSWRPVSGLPISGLRLSFIVPLPSRFT